MGRYDRKIYLTHTDTNSRAAGTCFLCNKFALYEACVVARLPQVGGDKGGWGDVLNDFLNQAHSDDGTLKTDSVGAAQLKPQSVTNAALSDGTIQQSKLSAAVQAKLDADTALADASVTTSKIADNAVTPMKLSGLGSADGIASLGTDGRLPEFQVPTRLAEDELSATFATTGELRSKVKTDGTDQTAVANAEIASFQTFGGGTIIYPTGPIRMDGRIIIPTFLDGTGAPKQNSMHLKGTGKQAHGRGSDVDLTTSGGTVFDMRWSDADLTKAKLFSMGFGYLEISGITFTDQGVGSATPFIKHTNTTVNIHDISGVGSPSRDGLTCDQDLIVAGGRTLPGSGDFGLSEDSPFQGYGSEYRNIWHNRIRRALVGGAYFNQVTVDGIYGWQRSGNATGGSIEIDPGDNTAQGVYGLSLSNVLCESGAYKHVVALRKVQRSVISNIGSYDYSGSTVYVSAINLNACAGLTVIAGYDNLDGVHNYITATSGQWRDQATMIAPSGGVNAQETSLSARVTAWNGLTARNDGGGAGPQLLFARPADALSGPQAAFSQYGTKWGYDGTGGGMSIDTGTGGSWFDLKAYGMHWYSQSGALLATLGAGKQGFTFGPEGDVSIERHATGVVKSNGRLRGEGGLSAAVMSIEPAVGTIDNGEVVFYLDPTPGSTKVKIVAKDSAGTVRRGEIPLA